MDIGRPAKAAKPCDLRRWAARLGTLAGVAMLICAAPNAYAQPFAEEGPLNGRSVLETYFEPLRHEHMDQPFAAPVAMMASGYITAAVAATIAFGAWMNAVEIERWDASQRWRDRLDLNGDGSIDGRDERRSRNMARGFSAVSVVGLAMGIAGTWLFVHRLQARRDHAAAGRASFDADVSGRGLTVSLRRAF